MCPRILQPLLFWNPKLPTVSSPCLRRTCLKHPNKQRWRWEEQRGRLSFYIRSLSSGNSKWWLVVTLLPPRRINPHPNSLLFPSPGHDFSAPLYRWVKLEVHSLPGSAASIRLQSSKSRAFPLITRQASGHEECLLLQDFFWKKSLLAFIYATLWKGIKMKGTEKTGSHSCKEI